MEIKTKTMIFIMIAVIAAGCAYLFATGHRSQGVLKGLDPMSFDMAATCSGIESHMLICNEENDMYLYLNGTEVFLEEINVKIDEGGDENTEVSYEESSISGLKKLISKQKQVPLKLWMTPNGKVECIMIVKKNIENNSASLKELGSFDPASYDSVNTVLKIGDNGMTLAPINYSDENAGGMKEFVKESAFNPSMKFYSMSIKETVKDGKIVKRNIQFVKSNLVAAKASLEQDKRAFVWFNDSGEVTAIMTISTETTKD